MCEPASGYITRTTVYWGTQSESHTAIATEHKLHVEGARGLNAVPFEISPLNEDYRIPLDQWMYHVDNQITNSDLPKWYDPEDAEARVRAALPTWLAAKVVLPGESRGDLTNAHIVACWGTINSLRGSSRVGALRGFSSVDALCGSSRVDALYDSSRVDALCGSSRVGALCDSSSVGALRGSSRVGALRGSSRVGALYDSSRVGALRDSSRVDVLRGSSRVDALCDSSRVDTLYDSSRVGALRGSSRVDTLRGSSRVDALYDSSSVGALCGSSRVDVYNECRPIITDGAVAIYRNTTPVGVNVGGVEYVPKQ